LVIDLYIYLSKILPLMVLPVGIVLELLVIALLLMWWGKRKLASASLLVALVVLWVSSTPIVAGNLLGKLEQQYPAIALQDIPSSGCIVLLGGSVQPVAPPRVDIDLSAAADRVYKAARLYREGKGNMIIAAGGKQPWSVFEQSEAEAMQILLLDFGVPQAAILLESTSRNTRENALNTKGLMEEIGCDKALLVTSASHMKRSVTTFERAGVEVYPVSTDVRVIHTPGFNLLDYLPDADALQMTTHAMREWIGQMVYQLRGWTG
jgi:uncharacterized SAM-binding protein YcdF (DUF218 family)